MVFLLVLLSDETVTVIMNEVLHACMHRNVRIHACACRHI